MKSKILFIDTPQPLLITGIRNLGYDVIDGTTWNYQKILDEINQYTGIVLRSRVSLDKSFFERAINLKFIAREGAGVEHIDLAMAAAMNIPVLTANEGNRDAVGEHAIGMLLCLMNNINRADAQVRSGIWSREENRGSEIHGKTVGIIGYGNMGTSIANKLRGFDCKIIAYDKYLPHFGNEQVQQVDMQTIFEDTDILTLHIPLTDETNYMVNDEFINKFRKNLFIINTSRGKILNTRDLVKNIQKGKVMGACLDVLEFENQSFNSLAKEAGQETFDYLIHSEKVILSPHIAGWTVESKEKIARVLLEKIAKLTLPANS